MNYDIEIEEKTISGFWNPKPAYNRRTYRGSGTVYHDLETGQRASTPMESFLADAVWLFKESRKVSKQQRTFSNGMTVLTIGIQKAANEVGGGHVDV